MASQATDTKTIAIVPQNRTDDPRIITVQRDTTVAEAIRLANLPDGVTIMSPTGSGVLAGDELLFDLVKDHDKLFASPTFEAGSNAFRDRFESLRELIPTARPTNLSKNPRFAEPVQMIDAMPADHTDAAWLKRAGWRKKGRIWWGYFRVGTYRPVWGCITFDSGFPQVAFQAPPMPIQRHRCVVPLPATDSWFNLHEHSTEGKADRTLRAIIASVEVWLQTTIAASYQVAP